MARRMKRSLSLLLALVMCLSLVNISAFAAGGGSSDQILADGYFTVDADNQATQVEGVIPPVTQDGYTVSKTIEGTSQENVFDITLKVETQQTVQTNDAAVMIIIDTSNSMDYCAECGEESQHASGCPHHSDNWRYNGVTSEQSRMQAVKDALTDTNGFIDSLLSGNEGGGKIYVSVVKFGSSASTVCEWTDITSRNGAQTVKNSINRLDPNGGTNLEAGLLLAHNRLQMPEISSASNKYTVLLSDGKPTFRVSTESSRVTSTTAVGNGSWGSGDYTDDRSGTSCSAQERSEAVTAAGEVKNLSTLYTICFGAEDDVVLPGERIEVCAHCGLTEDKHSRVELCRYCGEPKEEHDYVLVDGGWFGRDHYEWQCANGWEYNGRTYRLCADGQYYEATWESNGDLTVGNFLSSEIATDPENAYNAKDTAALNEAFKDIASSASEGNTGAGTRVIDPMGQYIDYVADSAVVTGGTVQHDANSDTLVWTLDPEDAQTSSKDGTTTYTFTLTYSITLDTAAKDFQETDADGNTKYYPTNGYTSLKVPGKNDVVFNVPGVSGTIPTVDYTIEYYKWDKQNGEYPDEPTKSSSDTAKVWTVVNPPAGYENEYDSDHYSYKEGNPATITVSVNPDNNVIRLYYKPDTAIVTVNHYYREDVTDVTGVTTTALTAPRLRMPLRLMWATAIPRAARLPSRPRTTPIRW